VTNVRREDPDAVLVDALRQEAPQAMEQLVERFADRVFRLALRITSSHQDAEEVTQDALWTAARKVHTFKGDSAFGSWLYRITANAAYMKLRSRRATAREIALDEVLPALDGGHFEPLDDCRLTIGRR
jgi:RNA polymerase sigma-70 factor (ECF subfamily)